MWYAAAADAVRPETIRRGTGATSIIFDGAGQARAAACPAGEPLPEGRFEVALLLETMLAFPDRQALPGEVERSYRADSSRIAEQIGTQATVELITAHQLWRAWLGSGRVRKFAMVAEKQ